MEPSASVAPLEKEAKRRDDVESSEDDGDDEPFELKEGVCNACDQEFGAQDEARIGKIRSPSKASAADSNSHGLGLGLMI